MSIQINGFNIEDESKIEFKSNPKRPGFKAFERYEEYQKSTTLTEYLAVAEKKYSKADLRFDEEKGFLKIFDSEGNQINLIEE